MYIVKLVSTFLNYNFVKNNNTKIVLAFDSYPKKVGTHSEGVPIYHIDELAEKLSDVRVAILTVPDREAQDITEKLVRTGSEGILNFTPARITVPDRIRVHHIDLAIELQSLTYFLKHYPLDPQESGE